jgi:hypothetical protein
MENEDELRIEEPEGIYGPKRYFKGYWMPVELIEDDRLSWMEKLLLVEIDALSRNRAEGCCAKNKHFARHLHVNEGTIANAITHLRRLGYVEDVRFDGRLRWIRARQPSSFHEGSLHKIMKPAASEPHSAGKQKLNVIVNGQAEQIYSAYPRKVAKPRALGAIRSALTKRKVPFDELLEKTQAFADIWADAPTTELDFIPYPASWFNAERYNDDPKTWRRAKQPAKMPYRTRENKINELNRRKQALIRANAPFWKIHEIDMQLMKL